MIKETINIDGKDITFKMSAATPRLYRAKFQKDLLLELDGPTDLEPYENLAWIAAGCPGKSVEKWLESFPPTAVVDITYTAIGMWNGNRATVEGAETANEGDSKNAATEEG